MICVISRLRMQEVQDAKKSAWNLQSDSLASNCYALMNIQRMPKCYICHTDLECYILVETRCSWLYSRIILLYFAAHGDHIFELH